MRGQRLCKIGFSATSQGGEESVKRYVNEPSGPRRLKTSGDKPGVNRVRSAGPQRLIMQVVLQDFSRTYGIESRTGNSSAGDGRDLLLLSGTLKRTVFRQYEKDWDSLKEILGEAQWILL